MRILYITPEEACEAFLKNDVEKKKLIVDGLWINYKLDTETYKMALKLISLCLDGRIDTFHFFKLLCNPLILFEFMQEDFAKLKNLFDSGKSAAVNKFFCLFENNEEMVNKFYWLNNYFPLTIFLGEPQIYELIQEMEKLSNSIEERNLVLTSGFFGKDEYGSQDIFNEYGNKAVYGAIKMIEDKKEYSFKNVLVYLGYQRYICNFKQEQKKLNLLDETKLDNVINCTSQNRVGMGNFRISDWENENRLLTPMFGERRKLTLRLLYHSAEEKDDESFTFEGSKMSFNHFLTDNLSHLSDDGVRLSDILYKDGRLCYDDLPPNEKDYTRYENIFINIFSESDLEIKKRKIIALHREMCIKVPHLRGGGSIAEWMAVSLFLHFQIPFLKWNQKPENEPWALAVTSGIDYFTQNYPAIFG